MPNPSPPSSSPTNPTVFESKHLSQTQSLGIPFRYLTLKPTNSPFPTLDIHSPFVPNATRSQPRNIPTCRHGRLPDRILSCNIPSLRGNIFPSKHLHHLRYSIPRKLPRRPQSSVPTKPSRLEDHSCPKTLENDPLDRWFR